MGLMLSPASLAFDQKTLQETIGLRYLGAKNINRIDLLMQALDTPKTYSISVLASVARKHLIDLMTTGQS